MKRRYSIFLAATGAAALALVACSTSGPATPQSKMSFFITSANPGKGGDFGGLAGADRYCQSLADSVGAGGRSWRAYLSTTATAGGAAVNARDRIGKGPWVNVKGVTIANNIDELHGTNNLDKQTGLTEKGEIVSASGDPVNNHDILTGSMPDGRASTDTSKDTTCGNWTKSGEGSAIVGHHNRMGTNAPPASMSWNSSHATQGCSLEAFRRTGGAGLMYCFAAN
ncbi:hypothetical protein [Variovorax ginsengisoli]|uniref:Lectin n=1 Tax=Variovorax ginsengisoli TaxID=363844 RepID=A0ABT8RY90_9BURK|nr:hypothetical protein [Variovorax ginsengisoli]MDN8611684.1 hypothetical protein [Variovorax ginsengisoli]MDO1530854.1 hypothetical protein [Variovorax ginsengisoli]